MAAKQDFDFTPTAEEWQFYGQLFKAADTENSGAVHNVRARALFLKSGLSPEILLKIWTIAGPDNQGLFTYSRFAAALRLLAHAQNGRQPDPALIKTEAPLVRIEGIRPAGGLVIPEKEREYYKNIFLNQNLRNGLLDGEAAREVFMKSKLSVDKLAQIWTLADTKHRGQLDMAEFIVAMYFIKHTMENNTELPATLPSGFYETAARQSQDTPFGGKMSIGGSVNTPVPALSPVVKHSTGLSTTSTSSSLATHMFSPPEAAWDVTDEAKTKYDRVFDGLDKAKRGYITGEEGVTFFLQSNLPHSVLAQIWDMANITKSGNLNRDEFAVAMDLIMKKRNGESLPSTLPNSLIPPSMRAPTRSTTGTSTISPRASIQPIRQATDVFDDLVAPGPTSLKGGPLNDSIDFFGSPDMQTQVALEAGELRNMQVKGDNAEAAVAELKSRRDIMETNLASLSNQKRDASLRLAQMRTLYDSQFKAFQEVEAEYKKEHEEFERVRNELVLAERTLASLQLDRDQLLQAMNREREETQELKRQIRITEERTSALKLEIEKLKKDSGQQNELITINKKQLATLESEYEKTKKVLQDDTIKSGVTDDSFGVTFNPPMQVPLPQVGKSEKDANDESSGQPISRDHSQHASTSSFSELDLKRPMSNASIGSTSTQSSAGAKSVPESASKLEDQKLDSFASIFGETPFGPQAQTVPAAAVHADSFNVSSDAVTFNGDLAGAPVEQTDSVEVTTEKPISSAQANDTFAAFKLSKPATDKDAIAAAFGAPSETNSTDTVNPAVFESEYPTLEEIEKSIGSGSKFGFDDDFTTASESQTSDPVAATTTVIGSASNDPDETSEAPGEPDKKVQDSSDPAEVGSPEETSAATVNSGLSELTSPQDDFDVAFRDLGEAKVTTASAEFDTAFDTFDEFNPSFDSPMPKDSATSTMSNNLDSAFQPDFSSNFGKASTPAELDAMFGSAASVFKDFDPFSSSNNQAATKSQPNLDAVFGGSTSSTSKTESGPLGFEDAFAEFAKPVKEETAQTTSQMGLSGSPLSSDPKAIEDGDDSEQVKDLISMGFKRNDVIAALEHHNYDKEKATNFLLDAATEQAPPGK